MRKIIYIDPVGPDGACSEITKYLDCVKSKDTKLEFTCLEKGPKHLEYRYYSALILPDLLDLIKKLEEKEYDAAIIGCFYDPGLYEAKEILERMVVIAPAEASLHIAATLSYKFSILVGRRKWIPQMMENVIKYGFKDRLASFKCLDFAVDEFHKDEKVTLDRMIKKANEAIEYDGAEAIILGCTMNFGFYKELQKFIKVPVIDPTIAAVKYAEFLIDIRDLMGWYTSKKFAFETPYDLKMV
ncbi:hydantoin racemase [Biomaibacter acetigenes]|uniref:Hydantoin racemase n=1 Tax=Biomaibacter acetigenes TaxID=2316383 RepID=A0A3G2R2T9_9FIRM|nr:aspartate/glutamate racemase family protein [Biomaibacter acetigenes]AYO29760.1 hydantoin racemase [Biomaibacter acetigenes]